MKRNIIQNTLVPFAVCFCLALALFPNSNINFEDYSTSGLELEYVHPDPSLMLMVSKPKYSSKKDLFSPFLGKNFDGFKEALAFKESQGNYFTVNTYGYLGKYQFGKETLKLIGVNDPNDFLNNPELQEKAFVANTKRNKWILRKDIKNFVGKVVDGVKVTESGILAAAHLAGPGSVKKFLRSYGKENFKDGFGTTVRGYMKKFSGYDTSVIQPDRKAKAI